MSQEFKMLIENRVNGIHNSVEPNLWFYWWTKENLPDLITRVCQ